MKTVTYLSPTKPPLAQNLCAWPSGPGSRAPVTHKKSWLEASENEIGLVQGQQPGELDHHLGSRGVAVGVGLDDRLAVGHNLEPRDLVGLERGAGAEGKGLVTGEPGRAALSDRVAGK